MILPFHIGPTGDFLPVAALLKDGLMVVAMFIQLSLSA